MNTVSFDLHQGDCLELMALIPDGSVDAIICDLPYGTTACKWDTVIPFEPLWAHYKRVIKPNGAIVLFGSQPFTSALVMSNPTWFKYEWVWEKSKASNFVHANHQPLKAHENILVFSKAGAAQGSKNAMVYNKQKTKGKPYDKGVGHTDILHLSGGLSKKNTQALVNVTGDRAPRSVQYFATAESDGGGKHPTQKPVALCEYLIRTYTNEGETVLDNTMGSGTTGVACVNTSRNFIGIEKDAAYFEIARNRIKGVNNFDLLNGKES